GGLGLDQDPAAGAPHLASALEAVLAHAGEDDEQHALAEDAGRVADRDVGAGAQAADLGLVAERDPAALMQVQVAAAGRDERRAGREPLAALRLGDAEAG